MTSVQIVSVNVTLTVQEGLGFYTQVSIDTTEVPAGVSLSVLPTSYSGIYELSSPLDFDFTLQYLAVSPGSYSFSIYGLIDDSGVCCQRIATMANRFEVYGAPMVPEPGTLALLGLGLAGLGLSRRRKAN